MFATSSNLFSNTLLGSYCMRQHQTERMFLTFKDFLFLFVLIFNYIYHPLKTVSPEVLRIWTWRTARGAANACVLQGCHSAQIAAPTVHSFFWIDPKKIKLE